MSLSVAGLAVMHYEVRVVESRLPQVQPFDTLSWDQSN